MNDMAADDWLRSLDASCVTRDALCLRERKHERYSTQRSKIAGRTPAASGNFA
jgi:hypothetical protein